VFKHSATGPYPVPDESSLCPTIFFHGMVFCHLCLDTEVIHCHEHLLVLKFVHDGVKFILLAFVFTSVCSDHRGSHEGSPTI
jgi:hypothetical protein